MIHSRDILEFMVQARTYKYLFVSKMIAIVLYFHCVKGQTCKQKLNYESFYKTELNVMKDQQVSRAVVLNQGVATH
jgi:hypothetical protein